VAGRFMEMLLKKVPGCVTMNPVQMAFSIAKVIIEIKDVGCRFLSWALADYYQAVGSNKDELVQLLEETASRLLTVERMVVSSKAAEKAMENLKKYVIFRAPIGYHKEHVTIQDPWGRNEEIKGPRQ